MDMWILLISIATIALSGAPGLLLNRRSAAGQWIAATMNVIGSATGAAALVLHHLRPASSRTLEMPWSLPMGRFAVGLDDLSLIFLIPMLLISALGSIYGLGYWRQSVHTGNGRKLRLCWGIMTAAMMLVVIARDGVMFLMAWECMAIAAFFLVSTEENKQDVRRAGWVYLVSTHVGTLCLFAFFALLLHVNGSFDLWKVVGTGRLSTAIFVLGAVGFGLKAGLMPLHVWLPGAHANAPSHVSAILSGVLLKTGVYGLVRLAGLMQEPPIWSGAVLLSAGTLSAVLGIAFAAGQRDLKRLLAYSSIENVGIIVMGIGLATLGRSTGRTDWIVLGLGGALLHLLNHSLFKPLLFMGAGCILHATNTRQMDQLGGLGRAMRMTCILFVIGSVAICGLPPLNGFVGELILYIGLFRTLSAEPAAWGWTALAAPALALVGALAVGAFVKLIGTVFSGVARSESAEHAHDPNWMILMPMGVLAGLCVGLGLFPATALNMLDRAIGAWAPVGRAEIADHLPVQWITWLGVALVGAVILSALSLTLWPANRKVRSGITWDCGYALPKARMQYSGSSFSQMMVELLSWVLWPIRRAPRIEGIFPNNTQFTSDVPDVVLDRAVLPAMGLTEWILGWARVMQRGPIQVYVLYVLGILILLLLLA